MPHKQVYFSFLHQHPFPLLSCLTHQHASILPARVISSAEIRILDALPSDFYLGCILQFWLLALEFRISRSNIETGSPDNRSWGKTWKLWSIVCWHTHFWLLELDLEILNSLQPGAKCKLFHRPAPESSFLPILPHIQIHILWLNIVPRLLWSWVLSGPNKLF